VTRTNGVEIYRGTSAINGEPIVALLVGLAAPSTNSTTGGMLQTYIMPASASPVDAWRAGGDVSVCGSCPYRSPASGGSGGCYVNLGHGPRAVWYAWQRGRYPRCGGRALLELVAGRALRIGTYGDPAAIPGCGAFWRELAGAADRHTGYTHRWRDVGQALRGVCMASADSVPDAEDAHAAGWATFRVAPIGDRSRIPGEAYCPASAESGKRTTCDRCPIPCNGRVNGIAGRVIQAHGATARRVG